jgi:hypothetical protein
MISPIRGNRTEMGVQVPLGHMGVLVPRDTSPGIRWAPASKATPPRAIASRSPRRGMRSRSTGRDRRDDHLDNGPARPGRPGMMRSTRVFGRRIDVTIDIGSAIEPGRTHTRKITACAGNSFAATQSKSPHRSVSSVALLIYWPVPLPRAFRLFAAELS